MYIVYWVILVLAAVITGTKVAQLQHLYKHRKVLRRDQREMAIGVIIMFLGSTGALLWALYNIWAR